MATRHNEKWAVAFAGILGAVVELVGSDSVRAADPRMTSKYFVQAVKDDAAAYLATDGDIDGTMLESAWRTYVEQHADRQPSKKEFAKMVLATYG